MPLFNMAQVRHALQRREATSAAEAAASAYIWNVFRRNHQSDIQFPRSAVHKRKKKGSNSRLVESVNGCWQREAISLSEHLSGVTQVLLLMHAASDATIERRLQPITRHK
jgi:hypothetical protein